MTELRILPAAELKQPASVLGLVGLLDQLLEVAVPGRGPLARYHCKLPVEEQVCNLGLDRHQGLALHNKLG